MLVLAVLVTGLTLRVLQACQPSPAAAARFRSSALTIGPLDTGGNQTSRRRQACCKKGWVRSDRYSQHYGGKEAQNFHDVRPEARRREYGFELTSVK